MWESALSISIFAPPLSVAAGSYAAASFRASFQPCSNSTGLTYFNVECMRFRLYQSSQSSTASLAWRMVSKCSPMQPLHLERSEQRLDFREVMEKHGILGFDEPQGRLLGQCPVPTRR